MRNPMRPFCSKPNPQLVNQLAAMGFFWILLTQRNAIAQLSFQPIGVGQISYGVQDYVRVSDDGRTVVFTAAANNHTRAFRWREATGPVALTMPSDDGRKIPESYCTDVSADGSRIVGRVHTASHDYACIWVDDEAPLPLAGSVAEFYLRDYYAISADGSTVAGTIDRHPTRWSNPATPMPLPALPSFPYGSAWAISADGSVIVGTVKSGTKTRGFRWTEAEGTVSLSGGHISQAWFVSGDGTTAVGSQAGVGSCRWTEGRGVSAISGGWPLAVSGDGSVVAGFWTHAGDEDYYYAAIWLPDGRRRDLVEYLRGIGVAGMDGWRLLWVDDISADAQTLVGIGRNPAGLYDYWIARIGPLCPGDVNADRIADLSDLSIVLANFGVAENAVRIEGDLDDDSAVNLDDLMQLLAAFGCTCD